MATACLDSSHSAFKALLRSRTTVKSACQATPPHFCLIKCRKNQAVGIGFGIVASPQVVGKSPLLTLQAWYIMVISPTIRSFIIPWSQNHGISWPFHGCLISSIFRHTIWCWLYNVIYTIILPFQYPKDIQYPQKKLKYFPS